MGVQGAAIATGISYMIPAFVGIYCFTFNKSSLLKFCKDDIIIGVDYVLQLLYFVHNVLSPSILNVVSYVNNSISQIRL